MFIGGVLIRRFDGFRRLCRHAAEAFQLDLQLPEGDLLLANRTLAALGGPPANPRVTGDFEGDGLPLLLLFLLTQEYPCRIGLIGDSDRVIARLKSLTHLLGHAVWPTLTEQPEPLDFAEVVAELEPTGVRLHPLFQYDQEGEPVSAQASGAVANLGVGPEGGPYTLSVLLGAEADTALLATPEELHPAQLILYS